MKKYDSYKDSGVKWLGQIPDGWAIVPGFTVLRENKSKNTGMIRNTVLSLSYGNIRVKSNEELTGLVPESFETYQLINIGDIIFRPTDLQNDKNSLRSSISNYEGIITNAYLSLQPKKNVSAKFLHYFFRAIDNNKIIYGLGSGLRQNISFDDFKKFLFPLPSLSEQQAIAEFLDNKAAKIDQLIAIKEKEINLLKERRQILIQKAVTKGLDPTVKLKDSGVDWIGEIPEHWEVRKLKYVFDFIRTGTTPPTGNQNYFDGEINWFNPKDLNEGILVEAEKKISNFAISQKEIKMFPGDSILIVGIGATSGKTAYLVNNATFNQQITGFHSITENNKFYYYFMKCATTLMLNLANYTTLPILNNEFFKSFLTIVPPINEQIQIVTYIEEKDEKMSKAILLKQQEMEKLNEYKTVLIDNVVTGKEKVF